MLETVFGAYADAVVTVILTTAAGFVADFALYRIWISRARTSKHQFSGAFARAIHWLPTLGALLIGIRLATPGLDLVVDTARLVATTSQVVAILAVTAKAAVLAGRLVRIFTSREDTHLPSSTIFVNLARGTVWVVGILVLLAALQLSIAPLIGALGIGGLAIGLALQPTLENLFGGIQVLMSRQVEPGDFIRLETGEEGSVRDITWRNTTIEMLSNDLVIVPNSVIAKSRVINFTSLDEQHSVIVPVGVAYGSDLDHVETVTREVARTAQREIEGAVPDWDPPVRFYEFGDHAIRLRVVLRVTRYEVRFPVQSEFIKRLHVAYRDSGIEIPFPQHTVHLTGDAAAAG